ncbi:hypothetical protein [Kitasatospora sp. GP82]|uniref:hypothetical protein n=1 Tax=Kitasatospora sp. GP82 TaxID=3035089 RepID=UPI00247558C4|nr:hypothetical protein [Kitasatospora sp. GP82]MDH6124738.1 phosphomannomutase [Kitasatospora sp. GP82]
MAAGNAAIYRRPGIQAVPVTGIAPSRLAVATEPGAKGAVMRRALDFAGRNGCTIDTDGAVEGIHATRANGDWVHVLPDPVEPSTHIWAEAADRTAAQTLLTTWTGHLTDAPGAAA